MRETVILLYHSSSISSEVELLDIVGAIICTYCECRTHMSKSIRRSNGGGGRVYPFDLMPCICRVTQRTFTSPQNNSVSLRSPLSCCSAVGVSFRAKSPPALYFVDSCRMLPQASAISVRSWLEFGFPNRMRWQVEAARFFLRDVKWHYSIAFVSNIHVSTPETEVIVRKMLTFSANKSNCRYPFFLTL